MSDFDEAIDTSGITTLEGAQDDWDEILCPNGTAAVKITEDIQAGRHKRDISRFLFVDIETIPDWDRLDLFGLEVPAKPRERKPSDQCPDVGEVLGKTLDDIKTDLRVAWPCAEWVVKLLDTEAKAKKPRAGVREAVQKLISEMEADQGAEAAFIKKMSVNPQYCKIAAMGLATGESKAVGIISSEAEMLEEFWAMASVSNPIVGFNHTSFDLPVILVRSMILGVEPTRKIDLKPWGGACLDLMVSLFAKGPAIRLKTLAKMYSLNVREEGCDGSQVHVIYQTDPDKLRRYVESDVELTRDLYRKIEGYFV